MLERGLARRVSGKLDQSPFSGTQLMVHDALDDLLPQAVVPREDECDDLSVWWHALW